MFQGHLPNAFPLHMLCGCYSPGTMEQEGCHPQLYMCVLQIPVSVCCRPACIPMLTLPSSLLVSNVSKKGSFPSLSNSTVDWIVGRRLFRWSTNDCVCCLSITQKVSLISPPRLQSCCCPECQIFKHFHINVGNYRRYW